MMNNTKELCLDIEVITSDFNKIAACFLLVISLVFTAIAAGFFCYFWRGHYIINKRHVGIILTITLGALIQLIGWSVFDIVGREGVPCWWIQTLYICNVNLLLAPIAARLIGFRFRVLINKRLARLHVAYAMKMNDLYAHLDTSGTESVASEGAFFSFSDPYMTNMVFFISARFSNSVCLLLLFLSVVLSYWVTRKEELKECMFPCTTESFGFPFLLLQLMFIAGICVFLLWKIRKEADPLFLRFEALLLVLIALVSSFIPMLIYFVNDDLFFRPEAFSPTLISVFGMVLLLLVEFVVPIYLVLKQNRTEDSNKYDPDLSKVLADKIGRDLFKAFAISEFSMENFAFYFEAKEYKRTVLENSVDKSETDEMRRLLIFRYIMTGAPYEINVSCALRENIMKNRNNGEANLFDTCVDEIFALMSSDTFARFKRTPEYHSLTGTLTVPEDDDNELLSNL